MPLKLKKTVKQMVAEANAEVEMIEAADALKLKNDPNILFVDIRDIRELDRHGRIPGALHAPRGMLEFWVDPETKYHREIFASGKKFLFFCAGGGRSALAAQTLQRMGLEPVCHMGGGFNAWKAAGGPVESVKKHES
jgi:rhodanese-related sulfurtransferase